MTRGELDWVRKFVPGAVEEEVQEDYVRRVSLTARACDDDTQRSPLGATDHERDRMLVRTGADGAPDRPGAPEALLCACRERLAKRGPG
jgi:hypothetical protein